MPATLRLLLPVALVAALLQRVADALVPLAGITALRWGPSNGIGLAQSSGPIGGLGWHMVAPQLDPTRGIQ